LAVLPVFKEPERFPFPPEGDAKIQNRDPICKFFPQPAPHSISPAPFAGPRKYNTAPLPCKRKMQPHRANENLATFVYRHCPTHRRTAPP